MSEPISEHDRRTLLSPGKLLGEDLEERMGRFGLIVENAYSNWDLSDRDMNAIRTANSMLGEALDILRLARKYVPHELSGNAVWPSALHGRIDALLDCAAHPEGTKGAGK